VLRAVQHISSICRDHGWVALTEGIALLVLNTDFVAEVSRNTQEENDLVLFGVARASEVEPKAENYESASVENSMAGLLEFGSYGREGKG